MIVLVRQRPARDVLGAFPGCAELVALMDLRGPVGVNLPDRDLRKAVVLEDRSSTYVSRHRIASTVDLRSSGFDQRGGPVGTRGFERAAGAGGALRRPV